MKLVTLCSILWAQKSSLTVVEAPLCTDVMQHPFSFLVASFVGAWLRDVIHAATDT